MPIVMKTKSESLVKTIYEFNQSYTINNHKKPVNDSDY